MSDPPSDDPIDEAITSAHGFVDYRRIPKTSGVGAIGRNFPFRSTVFLVTFKTIQDARNFVASMATLFPKLGIATIDKLNNELFQVSFETPPDPRKTAQPPHASTEK